MSTVGPHSRGSSAVGGSARQWVVAGAAALMVLSLVGGTFAWRAASAWFDGCTGTSLVVRDLADQLAENGFRPIVTAYQCSGSWTHRQDTADLWLVGEDAVDRDVVRQLTVGRLDADRWRPRSPSVPRASSVVPGDDAFVDPGQVAWDAGLARGRFALDLRVRSGAPAVVQLRLTNLGRSDEIPDGVTAAAPLPARELTEEELLRYSLAPVLRGAAVPPGYRGWEVSRVLSRADLDTGRRALRPLEGAAADLAQPQLAVGRAPTGLDPARTCGTGTWARFGGSRGCLLVGEFAGIKVYVPYRYSRDGSVVTLAGAAADPPMPGDQVEVGPPMAAIGTASVIFENVALPPGEVVVHGQAVDPDQRTAILSRADILAVFGSVRLDPGIS